MDSRAAALKASPAAPLLSANELIQRPLNYAKYRDMEGEFTEESLAKFVAVIANKYKTELHSNVSPYRRRTGQCFPYLSFSLTLPLLSEFSPCPYS